MRRKNYLKLAAYQTEQSKRHLDEVRSIHEEMRGYKHDFHHHLQTLKGQLEAGEIQRALAYVQQLDHELTHVDTLLKTGNVSLDAILSAKIAQAKKEQIAVTLQAAVPDQLTITDLELSIVVGNLLDNAIEACRSVQGERFIRIYMSIKGKMLYFSMLNSAGKSKAKRESCLPLQKEAPMALGCGVPKQSWRSTADGANTTAKAALSPRNFSYLRWRKYSSCTDPCGWCTFFLRRGPSVLPCMRRAKGKPDGPLRFPAQMNDRRKRTK